MSLEEIFGKPLEVKILDLIIPLSNNTSFTVEQIAKALNENRLKIHNYLESSVERKFLDRFEDGVTIRYRKREESKQAWALNNLILSVYTDKLRAESERKLGLDKPPEASSGSPIRKPKTVKRGKSDGSAG